jgi:hypothetical protein
MKLLLCKNCMSIFNLTHESKTCECGESKGHYTDNLNAVHSGPSIPIGFANSSFVRAMQVQELLNEAEGENDDVCCDGEEFTAFTIPAWAKTLK